MRIIETQHALLTNIEALAHANAVHQRQEANKRTQSATREAWDYVPKEDSVGGRGAKLSNLYSILKDTRQALTETPHRSDLGVGKAPQPKPEEAMEAAMAPLAELDLMPVEKLMLVNLRPNETAFDVIVEDAEERFNPDQITAVVKGVREAFGETLDEGGGDDEEMEDAGEEDDPGKS